jgi:hypothetical protein
LTKQIPACAGLKFKEKKKHLFVYYKATPNASSPASELFPRGFQDANSTSRAIHGHPSGKKAVAWYSLLFILRLLFHQQ